MAKTFTKTKAKTKSSHAQRALADTRQLAESITEWTALVNAVFGPGGVLSRHMKTQSARVAFSKSKEFAAIWDMIGQVSGTLRHFDHTQCPAQHKHFVWHEGSDTVICRVFMPNKMRLTPPRKRPFCLQVT